MVATFGYIDLTAGIESHTERGCEVIVVRARHPGFANCQKRYTAGVQFDQPFAPSPVFYNGYIPIGVHGYINGLVIVITVGKVRNAGSAEGTHISQAAVEFLHARVFTVCYKDITRRVDRNVPRDVKLVITGTRTGAKSGNVSSGGSVKYLHAMVPAISYIDVGGVDRHTSGGIKVRVVRTRHIRRTQGADVAMIFIKNLHPVILKVGHIKIIIFIDGNPDR